MVTRLLILSATLLLGAAYLAHATQSERVPPRSPLATLPIQFDRWDGHEAPALEANVLKVLGVDEYLNRVYTTRAEPFVSLYAGFYESQRQGDTIHSPLNCLPGAGWQPVRQTRASLPVTGADGTSRTISVNQFVIQKGLDRLLVFYWYQSHGRVVASEYTSKMYMVYDAMRLNRTDAALVRVITPIAGSEAEDEQAAAMRATAFVGAVFPRLSGLLPS
jgi:EpsI family protein